MFFFFKQKTAYDMSTTHSGIRVKRCLPRNNWRAFTKAEMIPLADGEVHLWLASYEDASGANLHATYRQVLANDERAQEKRFYFERDRRRYLVTRALVRTTLSRYLALLPVHWKFSSNSYGRPEIVNAEALEAGLSFNVSHT